MPKKNEKTTVKKKRKPRKKNKVRQYFHEGTQAAIEQFQAEESLEKKAKIYESEILPAFEKLSENLIFIHRFTSLHSSYEDLKNDCITFLYEALYKFDASRGTKAFSYFNVVAKNFLIIKSKQRTKFLKRNISLENPAAFTQDETISLNDHNSVPAQEHLFENADELEFLNKRAVFVYLREMSGLNPKQLTTTISSLKKKYNELRKLEEFDAFL
jgi:hypothetical protein